MRGLPAGDGAPGPREQQGEGLGGLRLQRNPESVAAQLADFRIELEWAESINPAVRHAPLPDLQVEAFYPGMANLISGGAFSEAVTLYISLAVMLSIPAKKT